MRICVLTEDRALSPAFGREHGLSLHVEAAGRRLLFDMGKTELFLRNAEQLGVDVSRVELAVLSHGHYDHGGGLAAFLAVNPTAPVFVHEAALERHYARRPDGHVDDIGVPPLRDGTERLRPSAGERRIADGLLLFSSVDGQRLLSGSNDVLLIREGTGYRPDPFRHEQSLLIEEDGKRVLLAGCAHRGILNILERAEALAGGKLDAVIGGFHLSNPRDGGCEPETLLVALADELASRRTVYYTCHCTGEKAFDRLKARLGAQLRELRAGSMLTL